MPFGIGKKRAVTDEPGATRPAGSKLRLNAGARTGLLLSTLLALLSFLTVLGALAALQRRVNRQNLASPVYREGFQSGNRIPYGEGNDVWGLPWWIFIFDVVICLVILFLACTARPMLRFKHVAMAFLVYVFVLVTLQIDSFLFFHRNSAIHNFLGRKRVLVALIAAIVGAVANGLQILFLGLLKEKYKGGALDHHHNEGALLGTGGKRVGAEPMVGTGNTGYGQTGNTGYGQTDRGVHVHEAGGFPHGQHPAGETVLPSDAPRGGMRTGPGMV
jgi:hypothetical protein